MRSSFALPAVFLCVFAAGARTPQTLLKVSVSDVTGKPIPHAEVQVKHVKGDKTRTMWKVHTLDDGLAKAPNEIPQGSYIVQATADGYATFSQTFELTEPQKTIEIKLSSGLTRINVLVTTLGGHPIDHADVVVKFVKGHSLLLLGKAIRTSWEMRTNQEGLAKVPEIPQGTILIQVIASGYQTFGQTFEVSELEKTINVKLNTPQEQYSAH